MKKLLLLLDPAIKTYFTHKAPWLLLMEKFFYGWEEINSSVWNLMHCRLTVRNDPKRVKNYSAPTPYTPYSLA